MTHSIVFDRRVIVALMALALLGASLVIAVRPARAVDEGCTGASEIIDAGSYYIVKGTSGDDVIDCLSALKPVEIRGGAGDDYLYGSNDYGDWLKGGHGDDWLYGYSENDYLYGGPGNDYMDGGGGTDTCLGGRGLDTFGSVGGGCEVADYGREP